MPESVHLVVEQGPDKGRELAVPPDGLRVGRAPKNDVVLSDPLLSRHHCRFFFKPGDGLWVLDLGSANQTLVNDKPVVDSAVRRDDRITIGDTVLRVVDDGRAPAPPVKPALRGAVVDLGLAEKRPRATAPGGRKGPLVLLAVLLIALAVAAALVFFPQPGARPTPAAPPADTTLELSYENVQASSAGIFRYHLRLDRDGLLAIDVDDTGATHVHKEKRVEPEQLRELTGFLNESGFFALEEEYVGAQPGILERRDISVTIGRRTHRVQVENRVEPPDFEKVRQKLEDFGHIELGLWALKQYPPEKLREMAQDAFLLGRKLYEEREVAYGNLASAIKSFTEAEFYLESIEPKPDFYGEILSARKDCEQELEQRFNNQNFLAERAIKLKAWDEAARALQVICEMIPDRADPRHAEARRKLLEVQSRLKKPR